MAEHLNKHCHLEAVEAIDKQSIEPGHIYVSPPGYHLLVESKNKLALSLDPPVNYSRPSIDLLFESAAEVYRNCLICVLLTGANEDGVKGMKEVHRLGGVCVAQDPKTAYAATMPEAAIANIPIEHVFALPKIGEWLARQGGDSEKT